MLVFCLGNHVGLQRDQQRECYGYEKQYAQFRRTSLLTIKISSRLAIYILAELLFLSFFCQLLFCFSIAAVEISDFIC